MANTREVMGERACLDAIVADTLTAFEDDAVTKVGIQAFQYHKLTSVVLPACTTIKDSGLNGCTSLTVLDMLGTGSFDNYALNSCTRLKHILLRGSSITTIGNANFLSGTPFTYGQGAVYVPSNLVPTYKADSGWGQYVILPLSAYPASDFSTISDSWDDIITACGDGTYASKYTVGDIKSIDVGGETCYMQLVAKDTDVLASNTSKTVATTWVIYRVIYSTIQRVHSSASTTGGWGGCELRTWLATDFMALLPSSVQSAIKEVRKYSDYYSSGVVHDQTTSDKIWIPSFREVFGNTTAETQGPSYAPITASATTRIRYRPNGTSVSTVGWWLRSASSATAYRYVSTSGGGNSGNANVTYGLCFGFCI